jgi:hypothetical protein
MGPIVFVHDASRIGDRDDDLNQRDQLMAEALRGSYPGEGQAQFSIS